MTTRSGDTCALCKHFTMREYPKHVEVGLGRCMGRAGATIPPVHAFRAWGATACEVFKRDVAGAAGRKAWIEKQRAKEQNNNAVKTERKG